jgi:hypothetical protein
VINREDVIKALECCAKGDCDNCPCSFGDCYYNLAGYALALIRDLTEENERLKAAVAQEYTCVFGSTHKVTECPITEQIDKAKADTVRKFAERLEESINGFGDGLRYILYGHISKVAREMMEESDEK